MTILGFIGITLTLTGVYLMVNGFPIAGWMVAGGVIMVASTLREGEDE